MSSSGWAVIVAALIAAMVAPWAKARIDRKNKREDEDTADKKTIATLVDHQVERLFKETDRLRAAYRADIDDLRAQLTDARGRVSLLEQEVAEWRAGVRGVVGVWVAVPAHVWDYVREHLPDLPPTRFPGERDALPPGPGDAAGQ